LRPEHKPAREPSEAQAFARLEAAVEEAVSRLGQLREDLREAQAQSRKMQETLRGLTGGDGDPLSLVDRLQELEAGNRDLLERLSKGRAGVERLLARVRFLEEQG
jgi:signal transduction histidine kinase